MLIRLLLVFQMKSLPKHTLTDDVTHLLIKDSKMFILLYKVLLTLICLMQMPVLTGHFMIHIFNRNQNHVADRASPRCIVYLVPFTSHRALIAAFRSVLLMKMSMSCMIVLLFPFSENILHFIHF